MEMTESLKAKEKEKFFKQRRERREQKENEEKNRADPNEDVSGDGRRGWPPSWFRKKAAHESANGGAGHV